MARKLTMMSVIGVALFYLVMAPTTAANAVHHTGSFVAHAGHQVATFLKALG